MHAKYHTLTEYNRFITLWSKCLW